MNAAPAITAYTSPVDLRRLTDTIDAVHAGGNATPG